jgi:hypothetical protein
MASKPTKEAPPTLYSAIPGQGLYSIGDATGGRRWIGAGREVNGWKVGDYDKKTNTLLVSKGDRTEYLQMGSGSISDYTPPTATPNAQTIRGNGGPMSDKEREMISKGIFQDSEGNMYQKEISEIPHIDAIDIGAVNKMRRQMEEMYAPKTATPEPMKTYKTIDSNGSVQVHFYNGDLPDDATPQGTQ